MNELERWLYFDGPEPEQVRSLLDALRDELPPATEEDHELAEHYVFAAMEAEGAPPVASAPIPELRAPAVTNERAGRLVMEVAEPELVAPSLVAPPPLAPAEVAPEAPLSRVQAPLAGTGVALDLRREEWEARARLPFRPAAPEAPGTPKVAKTMQTPAWRAHLGDTTPIGDDSISRAMALGPFLGNTLGWGKVLYPRMMVVQYAWFCVSLHLWPDKKAAIFKHYEVMHEAARAALDEHWREVFTARPEERVAFERAAHEYWAYLHTQPR